MTAPAEVPAVLTRQEEQEHLLQIAVMNRRIEEFSQQITEYRQKREEHEAALLASATATGKEIEECYGYRVRLNKGRSSTSWDATILDRTLPSEIKTLALSYTPKADAKVLNALADAGKLPESALDARTITPAQPRMIVEKVVPQ